MTVRRRWFTGAAAAALAGALALGATTADAGPARGPSERRSPCGGNQAALGVTGLTSTGRLVCFNELRSSRVTTVGTISGLAQDSRLVGLDYRPANGELIGVGDRGGVYRIDPTTAAATLLSRLSVPLDGTSFGVDFNPTVDRLRIVSDTGQNLRVNIADGVTATDGTLAYVPAPGQPSTPARGSWRRRTRTTTLTRTRRRPCSTSTLRSIRS